MKRNSWRRPSPGQYHLFITINRSSKFAADRAGAIRPLGVRVIPRSARAPIFLARLFSIVFLCLAGACAETGRDYKIESSYSVSDPQFKRTMGTLLGPPIVGGNSAVTLLNGDEIFPSMLSAIALAKQSITFTTFVYWSGETGHAFADAFCERARAGVHVHILIDAVGGSKIDKTYITALKDAGAEVVFYHALK